MNTTLEFDFSFQPTPIVKNPFSKGSTVYAVSVNVFKKHWDMETSFNFLGKKFETFDQAKEVGMKADVTRVYGKGAVKTLVTVMRIDNYLTPDSVLTREVIPC